jgi:hypothetical protein
VPHDCGIGPCAGVFFLREDAMHAFCRKSNLLWVVLLAFGLVAALPTPSAARPRPGKPSQGFRLFSKATGALTVNRIYCGLGSAGEICVDSLNSSTIGGGFWPKGTADQYVFNSGLQLAGIIGPDANPEWAGDTTAGQLFSPRGDNVGEQVEPIYNASDPDDLANWPEAAKVPLGDANENLYDPLLRGRVSASQGDVWFLSWEGNPSFSAGREHPLGVMVEQRGMGWNYPAGNEDVLYFIYTFYNVTARNKEAYAAVRPGMREIVERQGARFQDLNENKYSIDIPDGGYTLTNLFAAFGADMDVAESGSNYASVNVPWSLGYTYENTFSGTEEWTFDPGIFGPPFFPGAGFVGVKYLKSPEIAGAEVGLTLFSNTINGGAFDDASNATQLFRYLSNNISVAAGDAACNTGDPHLTKICYVNTGGPDDMRFFQASGPLTLAPGEFASIVVAYIFAAPVSVGACTGPGTCNLTPGDPTRLTNATQLAVGANPVDSVAGFDGYSDANGDGIVQQGEFQVVTGSLLGKARTAQLIFGLKFLLPFAPEAPSFFLIPGTNQVTVLWQPSATETVGDPFFATASQPMVTDPATGAVNANPLYDPNYRANDVEGYRVYRGRVDSPNSLTLLAQFDYTGTFLTDFSGQVNPTKGCAPELGIDNAEFGCAVAFDSVGAGEVPTVSNEVPLVGPIVQVLKGRRAALANGEVTIFQADTAITGAASGCLVRGTPAACSLRDTGIPFVYVDRTAKNNLRYFYSVTAFDINSFQSGPSSIESARVTKAVTPAATASNVRSLATLTQTLEGRGVIVSNDSTIPLIDPATGRFSGKFPAANGAQIAFVGQFAQSIFSGDGAFTATLIGLGLGDARNGIPISYTYATSGAGASDTVTISLAQPLNLTTPSAPTGPFPAALTDPSLVSRFGIPAGYIQNGVVTQSITGYQVHNAFGRGCHLDHLFGAEANCVYNGPRWFQGDNETKADPNAGNVAGSSDAADNNNAGELPGVLTIQNPQSYNQVGADYRTIEAALAGAVRAADFKVYWGEAGVIDSVMDVTHNVEVPFMADSLGAGWGILNQAASAAASSADGRPELSLLDFGCVFPLNDPNRQPDQAYDCGGGSVPLSNTAIPGSIVIAPGSGAAIAAAPARANPGFGMYLAGHIFLFELAPGGVLPTDGTVWTMRSYIGVVSGGNGAAGNNGPYSFTPAVRNFSALGATLRMSFSATNSVEAATNNDLRNVHTVPDPYYVTSGFEQDPANKVIKFVNLPAEAIVRIYSSSGVLVALLEHRSSIFGGDETWNVRNRNNQVVASGVYFYHIEAGDARRVGRFTVVNFAQ